MRYIFHGNGVLILVFQKLEEIRKEMNIEAIIINRTIIYTVHRSWSFKLIERSSPIIENS